MFIMSIRWATDERDATRSGFSILNTVIHTINTECSLGSSPGELHCSTNSKVAPGKGKIERPKATLEHAIEIVHKDEKSQHQQRTLCFQITPLRTVHRNVKTCTISNENKKRLKTVLRDENRRKSSPSSETLLEV